MNFFKKIFYIIVLGLIFLPIVVYAISIKGVEYNNLVGWAWSDNIGWIGFSCHTSEAEKSGNSGGNVPTCSSVWGAHIIESGESLAIGLPERTVIGHAWSDNIGWISFQKTETNIPPSTGKLAFDSLFLDKNFIATVNSSNRIVGWARVLSACTDASCTALINPSWDGWIYFPDDASGVTIDSRGRWSGFAWGGAVLGWISFDASRDAYTGTAFSAPSKNTAPVASMVTTPNLRMVGTGFVYSVNVDASASYDVDTGDILTYFWDFGDGINSSGITASHVYATAGNYKVSLVVTDNKGLSSTVTQSVNFVAPDLSACLITCAKDSDCNISAGDICLKLSEASSGFCTPGPTGGSGGSGGSGVDASGLTPFKCTASEKQLNILSLCKSISLSSDFQCGDKGSGPLCVGPELSICPENGICPLDGSSCNSGESECRATTLEACPASGVCSLDSSACTPKKIECIAATEDKVYNCTEKFKGSLGTVGGYSYSKPEEPPMPIGLLPNGEACTKPTTDSPNNCEGINGCLYYDYTYDGKRIDNNSVANCTSESKDTSVKPTGCVYYANGLTNCLVVDSFSGIPEDCRVIRSKGDITVDCRDIGVTSLSSNLGKGCIFKPDGVIDCTSEKSVGNLYSGCIYTPNPENGISCPGVTTPKAPTDEYVDCVLSDVSVGSVIDPTTACFDDGTCPEGDVCLKGTCVSSCEADVSSTCDIGTTCRSPCPKGTLFDSTTDSCKAITWFELPECKGSYLKYNPTDDPFSTLSRLAIGTTQIYSGITTDKNANCKYSTNSSDVFDSTTMIDFLTTGTLIHETQLSGLKPLPEVNDYLVRCQETATGDETNACKISISVGEECLPDGSCRVGECLDTGYCGYPTCSGAIPPRGAVLPSDTTSTVISMKTDSPETPSTCRYSTDISLDYFGMTNVFGTVDNISHSSGVSGLVKGYNAYYVQCQDTKTSPITGKKEISGKCQIGFKVGDSDSGVGGPCTTNFDCQNGWTCNIATNTCIPPSPCTTNFDCQNGWTCNIATNTCIPPIGQNNCPLNTNWDPNTQTCIAIVGSNPSPGGNICNVLGIQFQGTAPGTGIGPTQNCSILAVILAIVQWFAWLVALIAVVYGLRGGYLYITSGGNETKLEESKKAIIYTMIGVVVAILSFSFVAIARAVAGI
jgi:PKD repeat protein